MQKQKQIYDTNKNKEKNVTTCKNHERPPIYL